MGLLALDVILGGSGKWAPLFMDSVAAGEETTWHRVGQPGSAERLVGFVGRMEDRFSPDMALGLAQPQRQGDGVRDCPMLWCRVEGDKQVKRAHRFRSRPTLVIGDATSSKRLLMWWLTGSVDYFDAVDANRKLAYHLGAPQKVGKEPDLLRIPVPGSCLRTGRARPSPVVVTRCEPVRFELAALVGGLKQPPDPDAWRK